MFELWGGWPVKSVVASCPSWAFVRLILLHSLLALLFVTFLYYSPYKCFISSFTFFYPCLCWGNKSLEDAEFRGCLHSDQPAVTTQLQWIRIVLLHTSRTVVMCVVGHWLIVSMLKNLQMWGCLRSSVGLFS